MRVPQELYSQAKDGVGVMFARSVSIFINIFYSSSRNIESELTQLTTLSHFVYSIPNFTEFYSEDVNKGMECIRLLNEIIGNINIYAQRFYLNAWVLKNNNNSIPNSRF